MNPNPTRPTPVPKKIGLREGDKGLAVGELQQYLRFYGYLPLTATLEERLARTREVASPNLFDDETVEALRAYQTFKGLRVTGILDENTVADMAVPRCGVPDIWNPDDLAFGRLRFSVMGRRWFTSIPRYGFVNFHPKIPATDTIEVFTAAFDTWSEVSPLTFREPNDLDDAEIRIQFSLLSRDRLGEASYPPEGDIWINKIRFFDWSTSAVVPPHHFDLQSTAIHEIGHALGLGHSTERDSVMWPNLDPGRAVRTLHQDDIGGIQKIYGPITPGQHQTRVPVVRELKSAAAADKVRAANLKPAFSGPEGPDSWVWRQSPRAQQIVDIGSEVTMQLRDGPLL